MPKLSTKTSAPAKTKTAKTKAVSSKGRTAPKKATTSPKKSKATPERATLGAIMRELELAGTAQTRKTYARHGVPEPMFGVSFAVLQTLLKRIGVDHGLALALWDTGNYDARNLALKIADPATMTSAELDRWARESSMASMCGSYVAVIAEEGPYGVAKAAEWSDSTHSGERATGWMLIGCLASRNTTLPDAWFEKRLGVIERTIHAAPNMEREAMNRTVIAIGCRNAALRKAALSAAKRIGPVDIDHGDTSCETPDAAGHIAKAWAHSTSKGFASPAAHERTRKSLRLRC